MSPERLRLLKLWASRLWFLSPERLWLLSVALQDRGRWVLAFWLKQLNTRLYHNSLSPEVSISPDILLGHYSLGIVVSNNVTIGRRVKIWHNVTITSRSPSGSPHRIVIEDDVIIGANAVVIAKRGHSLQIGRGAKIGAGTVVNHDVPVGATVVNPPARVLLRDGTADGSPGKDSPAEESFAPGSDATLN
jgi:serine O-acetyltransferase